MDWLCSMYFKTGSVILHAFEKVNFDSKSADDNKSLKNIQRANMLFSCSCNDTIYR